MRSNKIQRFVAIAIIAGTAGSCATTRTYQVDLVDAANDPITTVDRTVSGEKAYIAGLHESFADGSVRPEEINRYVMDAKLFLELYPDATAETTQYVAIHGFVASMRGVRNPPADTNAFTVQREYVRHGFAAEAIFFLGNMETDTALPIPTEDIRSVLVNGIWYGNAIETFANAILRSMQFDGRKQRFIFDTEAYIRMEGELRENYPKWYQDVSAARVAASAIGRAKEGNR